LTAYSQSDYQAHLKLRPLSKDDFPLLVDWINAAHVAPWWDGPADINWIAKHYSSRLAENALTRVYIAEIASRPIGFIKFYRYADYPDWDKLFSIKDAVGIDYLIGEFEFIGKGLGSLMIKLTIPIIFNRYPNVDIIIAAPKRDNYASCHSLQKAGFKLIEDRLFKSDNPVHNGIKSIYGLHRDNMFAG
jgi:aminoglycoside 6'-N-acetyltransferase